MMSGVCIVTWHHCFQMHSFDFDMFMYLCYKMSNVSFIILVFDTFPKPELLFHWLSFCIYTIICVIVSYIVSESGEFFRASLVTVVAIIVKGASLGYWDEPATLYRCILWFASYKSTYTCENVSGIPQRPGDGRSQKGVWCVLYPHGGDPVYN